MSTRSGTDSLWAVGEWAQSLASQDCGRRPKTDTPVIRRCTPRGADGGGTRGGSGETDLDFGSDLGLAALVGVGGEDQPEGVPHGGPFQHRHVHSVVPARGTARQTISANTESEGH